MGLADENLHNLFKESLEGFKVDPDAGLWSKLEEKLDASPIRQFNKETFEGIKVEPSEGLWNLIARRLWFSNFTSFSVSQFNIYYATVAILTIVGLSLYFGNQFDETNDLVSENYNTQSSPANLIVDDKSLSANIFSEPSLDKAEPSNSVLEDINTNSSSLEQVTNSSKIEFTASTIENISVEGESVIKETHKTVNNNVSGSTNKKTSSTNPDLTYKDKWNVPKNIAIAKTIKSSGLDIENNNLSSADLQSKTISETEEILIDFKNDENVGSNVGVGTEMTGNNSINNKTNNTTNNTIIKSDDVSSENIANKTVANYQENSTENLTENSEADNQKLAEPYSILSEGLDIEAEGHEQTQPVDLDYPDTVGIDASGNPIVWETTHYYLNIFGSSNLAWNLIGANNEESQSYVLARQNSESYGSTLLGSAGADFMISFKKSFFRAGVNYASFGESYQYNDLEAVPTSEYEYISGGYYHTDTIMITHIDSLIGGSQYQVPYIQRTWVETMDSNVVEGYDTVIHGLATITNNYQYIEIPISLGYLVDFERTCIYGSVGLTSGILIGSKGKTISNANFKETIDISDKFPYNNINFAANISAGMLYRLNNRVGIFGEFYLRHGISSMFSEEYQFSQRHAVTGFKLGIRLGLNSEKKLPGFYGY